MPQGPRLLLPQHIGLPMFAPDRKPKRIHLMSLGVLNLPRNRLLDWSFGHSLISCHVEHHLFPSLSDNMCLKVRWPPGGQLSVLGGNMAMRPSISSSPPPPPSLNLSVLLTLCERPLTALWQPLPTPLHPHSGFFQFSTPCSFSYSQFQPATAFWHSGLLPALPSGAPLQHCAVWSLVQLACRQTSCNFGRALTCCSQERGVFTAWAPRAAPAQEDPKAGPLAALQCGISTHFTMCIYFQSQVRGKKAVGGWWWWKLMNAI